MTYHVYDLIHTFANNLVYVRKYTLYSHHFTFLLFLHDPFQNHIISNSNLKHSVNHNTVLSKPI